MKKKKLKKLANIIRCSDSTALTFSGSISSSCGCTISTDNSSTSTALFHDEPEKNGFACPDCGSELFDNQPTVTIPSFLFQKSVKCFADKCGYSGYR